jgi:1-deoxy-D-xylulose-5-phosphate reductoisomerase
MMNKALEVIEASYLFDMPPEKISVMIHPQSVVHSMVEYNDGSILAQMGASDMRTPIAYALAWPKRMATPGQRLDLAKLNKLTFEEPDYEQFPALMHAYECLKKGLYAGVALNAANEVAVEAFLTNHVVFTDIMTCVEDVLAAARPVNLESIGDVIRYDQEVKQATQSWLAGSKKRKAVTAR